MTLSLLTKVGRSYKFQRLVAVATQIFWRTLSPFRRLLLGVELRRRKGAIHIHFGCGSIADARFINVDARALAHVHLVSKSPFLKPFSKHSAESIYACHVLEHLPFHDQPKVLARWLEILKPGGRLILSVPDFDKIVDKYMSHDRDAPSIQAALMGGQDYAGNFHCAIFTRKHLQKLLQDCGFVDVSSWHPRTEHAWPKDFSWADDISLNLHASSPGH